MKQKLVLVITKSNWGGAQRNVYDLATSLQTEYEVVVAAGGTGKLFDRLALRGVRTVQVAALSRDVDIFTDVRACVELFKLFQFERPDIVHLHSSKVGGIGALAARLAGVRKIIYTVHGYAGNELWRPPYQRTLIGIAAYLTTLLATRVIAVSEHDARTHPSARTMTVIYPGVKVETSSAPFPNNTSIATIAELHRNKGLDTLILALNEIPGTTLTIYGEGEERANLTTVAMSLGILDRVRLVGFTDDAPERLHQHALFVLPSRKEGLPYTILEAGAVGAPVVSTRVGGIPEVITHERTGLLVPSDDVPQLADAIRRALADQELRARLGAALRIKVASTFSPASMVARTRSVYES